MKIFLMSICLITLFSCGGEIKSNFPKSIPGEQQDQIKIDVFALTFYKQTGSCTSLPISHRTLLFSPVLLNPIAGDYFIGTLEVMLDEQSKTYKALYREYPIENNTDQSQFQITLNGNFEVTKAVTGAANDQLTLENIGVVTPTISGNVVKFNLELGQAINKSLQQVDVPGRVMLGVTSLVDDNCLL